MNFWKKIERVELDMQSYRVLLQMKGKGVKFKKKSQIRNWKMNNFFFWIDFYLEDDDVQFIDCRGKTKNFPFLLLEMWLYT